MPDDLRLALQQIEQEMEICLRGTIPVCVSVELIRQWADRLAQIRAALEAQELRR